MGSVEVYILGQRYAIRGDENPEYIQKIAEYVDSQLRDVYSGNPNTPPLKAAILAALNIADALHKSREECASLSESLKSIEEKADTIISLFD